MPPFTAAVVSPVLFPKQRTFVFVVLTLTVDVGCEIITEEVYVQLLESVMVTVYVHEESEFIFWVVDPLLHA